jgi:predicted DNA-binding transcriptional regulator AlpA
MTTPAPRLMSGSEAAAYCGVTPATWSKWVSDGSMPKPVIGRRWDRKAIDLALDKASGIVAPSVVPEDDECPLEKWMREDAEKQKSINRVGHRK